MPGREDDDKNRNRSGENRDILNLQSEDRRARGRQPSGNDKDVELRRRAGMSQRYVGDYDQDDSLDRQRGNARWRDEDDEARLRRRIRDEDDDRDRGVGWDEDVGPPQRRNRSPGDIHDRRGLNDRSRSSEGNSDRPHQEDEEDDRRDKTKKGKGSEPGAERQEQDEEKEAQERRRKRRPFIYVIAAVVVVLLIAGGLYYWLSTRDLESTDDAYTDGRVVNIAPQVAGQVVSLDVTDNQFVRKGDPLIHVDPRQFVYDRNQSEGTLESVNAQVESQKLGVEIAKKNFPSSLKLARANLVSSRANLALQAANLSRQKGLPKQATTQQDVDQAQSSFEQAKAQVEQDEARVTQAEPVPQNIGQSEQQVNQLAGQVKQSKGKLDQSNLNVEWSVVRAPQDGWVTQRNVDMGNYIAAGQQIMSLVTPDLWVTANFKETQLARMRPGQRVDIKVDAYPNLKLSGHVDSVQRGSGSRFSAFPAQNATGNFVKIVQRVPVKIIVDSGVDPNEPIPIGISVTPIVTLR